MAKEEALAKGEKVGPTGPFKFVPYDQEDPSTEGEEQGLPGGETEEGEGGWEEISGDEEEGMVTGTTASGRALFEEEEPAAAGGDKGAKKS
jgi:hypothetical protein